jgi:hypothetical protein
MLMAVRSMIQINKTSLAPPKNKKIIEFPIKFQKDMTEVEDTKNLSGFFDLKRCVPNEIYQHRWVVGTDGLSMPMMRNIDQLCEGKWSWGFELSNSTPSKHGLILYFELILDLIQVKLSINLKS